VSHWARMGSRLDRRVGGRTSLECSTSNPDNVFAIHGEIDWQRFTTSTRRRAIDSSHGLISRQTRRRVLIHQCHNNLAPVAFAVGQPTKNLGRTRPRLAMPSPRSQFH
jgi:hypothetical protein